MTGWREIRLGDVAKFIDYRGKTPRKTESGIPLITAKIVKNGSILPPNEFIAESDYDAWMTRGLPKTGDVVLTTEAPLGEVAQLKDAHVALAQRIIVLRAKEDVLDNTFLKYFLLSSEGQARLKSRETGTTVTGIKSSELQEVLIPIPALSEQKQIARILSSLDDKIEVNNQINRNLEEQVQTLYRDFFDETEKKDSIRQGKLKDVCFYVKEKIPVSDLTVDNYFSTENLLTDKKGAVRASSLPQTTMTTKCAYGNILVSNIRPYFKKILFVDRTGGCSADVLCFQAKTPQLTNFLYSTLYFDSFFDYMTAGSKGTKMPRGDKDQIMDYPIPIPDLQSLEEFNLLALPLLKLVQKHKQENTILAQTRDTLLPKLISKRTIAWRFV